MIRNGIGHWTLQDLHKDYRTGVTCGLVHASCLFLIRMWCTNFCASGQRRAEVRDKEVTASELQQSLAPFTKI